MHILLVRFSSMGDVVLQTATINWLRSIFGKSLRVTFVTSREFGSLLESHPFVDEIITFDRKKGEKWGELIKKIENADDRHPVDFILDLHATLRSFRLRLSFWSLPALTVDKRRWERFLLTKLRSKTLKRLIDKKVFGLEPQVERIIKDFDSLFGGTRGIRGPQDLRKGPHGELTSLGELPKYPLPGPYVVLAPSVSFLPKRWPINSFVELARKLLNETSWHLVILAGPEDNFCSVFDIISSPRLINLQGKTTLKESMSILAEAKLCIGNDSGMNHIAEAHGVPVVTIFGPTDPLFGFAPHGKNSAYLSKELWCKPCSTTGKKACFRDQHYCMDLISVEDVFRASLNCGVSP
jgi:ADP-heptose:LPS heptosyltransferase